MSWFFLQPMYDGNAYPETWVPLTRHKRAKPTTIRPRRRAKLHSGQGHPGPRDLRFFSGKLLLWTVTAIGSAAAKPRCYSLFVITPHAIRGGAPPSVSLFTA